MMDHNFDFQIITKHLEHQSNAEEKTALLNWLLEDQSHYNEYFVMKQIWSIKHANYYAGEKEIGSALNQFNLNIDNKKERNKLRNFYRIFISTAAIFIIGFFTFFVVNSQDSNSEEWFTYNNQGEVTEVILDDGSKVYLNSDTEISFRRNFINQDNPREVRIRGEAYFEVKKDVFRPFIVDAGEMKVKVLGTEFNIKTEDIITTTLIKGKIAIVDNKGKLLDELEPGQTAIFDPEHQTLDIENTNAVKYTTWRFEQTVFDNILFMDLIKEIEERYDVSIMLEINILENKKFRFVLNKNESIEDVMKSLKYIAPIDYTLAGNNKILVKELKK